ncbi:MAG: hypothetical protein NVS4B2_30120 [Chloroflexota bacterium]
MGRKGYLIMAVVDLNTALIAALWRAWPPTLFSALNVPCFVTVLVRVLAEFRNEGTRARHRRGGPRQDMDLFTVVACSHHFVSLVVEGLSLKADDVASQELRTLE